MKVPWYAVRVSHVNIPIREHNITAAQAAEFESLGITSFVMPVLVDQRNGKIVDETDVDMHALDPRQR